MTDPDLRAALQSVATTYPRWMDRADAVATWEFRRLVAKAGRLRTQSRDLKRWRSDSKSLFCATWTGCGCVRVEGRAA